MATTITDITITQDNLYEGSSIIPIHSPVVYIAEVTYSGDAPDYVNVQIIDESIFLVGTYRAIYLDDQSATVRRFAFIANDAIKSLMGDFEDVEQLSETLVERPDIKTRYLIRFIHPDFITIYDTATGDFAHGAAQFGSYPNLTHVYSNSNQKFYGLKDDYCYVYFYASGIATTVSITDNGVLKGTFATPNAGYYAYKTLCDTNKTVNFDDSHSSYDKTVKIVDECSEGRYLKWLDNDGYYRFYPFNKFYETQLSAELIGTANKFITNILTDQTNRENIGSDVDKIESLTATNVDSEALDIFSSIYASPRVLARISNDKWVQVTLTGDGISRRRKSTGGKIDIQITYPEYFNIKMI